MNFSSLKKVLQLRWKLLGQPNPHPLASPKMCCLLDFSIYLPECEYFVVTAYALVDSPHQAFCLSQFLSMASTL